MIPTVLFVLLMQIVRQPPVVIQEHVVWHQKSPIVRAHSVLKSAQKDLWIAAKVSVHVLPTHVSLCLDPHKTLVFGYI
jgi:hypothetical protein